MGRVLACAFVTLDGEAYSFRADEKRFRGRSKIDDSKLVAAIREEWERHDMIVTWNGKMFDVPFINARLLKAGERPFSPHFHLDMMWYAKGSSARIGSAKLENVQKFFKLGEAKTAISWEQWQMAASGDTAAMDEVVEHAHQDVLVLREAYHHLLPMVRNIHR